jgi:hypothetical protein
MYLSDIKVVGLQAFILVNALYFTLFLINLSLNCLK